MDSSCAANSGTCTSGNWSQHGLAYYATMALSTSGVSTLLLMQFDNIS
jgi:hypothetical protein